MKNIFSIAALCLVLFGCGDGGSTKVSSNGGMYEIFVVCTDDKWKGEMGDTLRNILQQPIAMLNQSEPTFTLLHIQPTAFTNIIGRHRNILSIKNGAEYHEASITAQYDIWASPQIVVNVTGPSTGVITQYICEHRTELLQVFELAERDRALSAAARYNERSLGELIEKKFGIKMNVPKGYKLRSESDDFIWISLERPQISQGFFIYSYPYQDKEDFETERLLARRNEFGRRIPGPADGSFMSTYMEDPMLYPTVGYVSIAGRHWAKMNGFWEVEGDFMGGPFFTYSTLNHATNKVVALDCYLFSPKQPKRNYFHQLEHLVYSITIDE